MLYLFDKNEKLIHELASNEFESLIQHEELNKLMTLEFAVFIDSNDKMKDIEYVAHKDMEDYGKIQMYRIISSESDDYSVNYQAVHIIFDELKSYGYIRDKRPERVKASAALGVALAGSRWKVGRVDDSDLLSTNFYDCTRLDALSKIIKTWNLDVNFYLTFDGNKITGRYIDLLSFRGEDTGERFVYGSNALEVVKEVDVSDVYTRVIPRGKGEEKVDEEGKPTNGYGRRIKINDVVWEKSKGDPVDKPKGQEFLELKDMTERFGFSNGEPRTRVQIFEDIEDPKELIKAGYDFLVKVSRPLVQFKTKISKRSRTNVGDIVRVIRKDLDFYYRTRIYKAHRNLLNETLEVEFGDKLVQSPADREKIVSDNLNALENRLKETESDLRSSFVDKVVEGLTHATFNRDGYNYELKKGNKYGLPAGYYSFDREIDDNPQRVIYVGAGTLAIADSKKSNGDWDFRTFGTGQGFVADLLVAGTILGGKVRWNLEDGTFIIGDNPSNYSMYWDGSTLHLRDVDIDLENNTTIKNMIGDINENKVQQDNKNKSLDQEILDLKSSVKITDGKISTSVESLTKDINNRDKDIRSYITNNYSTKTQTDKLIESKVGMIRDDLTRYESRIQQFKDEINLKVSSQKGGVYKNLIKNGWKWTSGEAIYWYPNRDKNGVARGGSYYIENYGDLRFTSNKDAGTWTEFAFDLLEIESGTKEYTLICEPSEIKNTVQLPQFKLDDKYNKFLCYGTTINKSNKVYKLTLTEDNQNKIPYRLKLSFRDSQAGTDKDRSIVIPQRKLALVKGWHPNLTWDDVYFPNHKGIEDLQSELKIKTDRIEASVKDNVAKLESQIKIQANEISSKVSNSQFSTKVRQSATDIKFAWNNYSKYIQFEHGSIGIYDGSVTSSKKRSMFDENGIHFYRDGYYVGKIGTNKLKNDSSKKGLEFDLEYKGAYMTWSAMENTYDDAYTMKWTYAKKYFDGYSSDTLHAGCDINMQGHKLRNVDFEGGGLTGHLYFAQITSMNSDGTASEYATCNLNFENGILVGGSWAN